MLITLMQGDVALEYDTNENLAYLQVNGCFSQDYTIPEMKEMLNQMLINLENVE